MAAMNTTPVDKRAVFFLDKLPEQGHVLRLAVSCQPGDLALVLMRFKAAHVGHVGIIIAQRMKGRDLVQRFHLAVASRVDPRAEPVAAPVQPDHQRIFEPAGKVGRGHMREVMVYKLDRTLNIEFFS